MWWVGFAVVNWLGVAYLKERGPEILKPTPLGGKISPAILLLYAMYGAGLFGIVKIAMKWIKKKV